MFGLLTNEDKVKLPGASIYASRDLQFCLRVLTNGKPGVCDLTIGSATFEVGFDFVPEVAVRIWRV